MSTVLFFLSCLLLFYTVVGYPLLIWLRSVFAPLPVVAEEIMPPISVILCIRNEARIIGERIVNLLEMDYPRQLLEIIVVSDGSTDGGDKIVESFVDRGVILVRNKTSLGKAVALNIGIEAATHEMLLLCDARQRFAPDVAKRLIGLLACPGIGAVSGRLVLQSTPSVSAVKGVGIYWNYEVWLRKMESGSGSVIGVTGAIYALRKSFYSPIPAGTVLDDVLIPMQVIMEGGRVLYDDGARAYDNRETSAAGEMARKVRTLYGNLQLFTLCRQLFFPWKNPAWFRFISHKMMRLLLPFFLIISLFASLFAAYGLVWIGLAQCLFWLGALICLKRDNSFKFCRLAGGFLLLNIAVVRAWFYWLSGRDDVWLKSSSPVKGGIKSGGADT